VKHIKLTNKDKSIVFADVSKTIYIADKNYYKEKTRLKEAKLKSI
jgi:hypothetical protein